jgi:DNA-3-methyladenine glycosylase I
MWEDVRMPAARSSSTRGTRCWWCGTDPVYVKYHDTEWGVPVTDDAALYEKLVLDGFQAGLSWITVLRKRPAFREAFRGFDPAKVARFGARDVARLLKDEGIIRSRAKIDGAIANARAWESVMEAGGRGAFRDLLWQHVGHATKVNALRRPSDIRPTSTESERMAKTLKKAGFKFCGPTICYAYMQAVGMVNDHLVSCPRHEACAKRARKST